MRRQRAGRVLFVCLALVACLSVTRRARGEKILEKTSEWTVFTDGRAGAFFSQVYGDGYPRNLMDVVRDPGTNQPILDPGTGLPTQVTVHDVRGGGFDAFAERQPNASTGDLTQGTVNSQRIRSGFIDNIVGIGVRIPVGASTATAYVQFWSFVESEARQKNRVNFVDVRQGYTKIEGTWGSVLAGKSRTLFSRGATDIDTMYAHRYGLGFPGNIDSNGPTLGHIGFGVLGSGFAAGIAYATPSLAGLQITVGAFDPIQLQGAWQRTKWVRPETEITYERRFGATGKVVLFGNGAYQKLYKVDDPTSTYAGGFGYGGRFELGFFHLGVAGHYGRGLGLNYALEVSDASLDQAGSQRNFDGYYVQSQFVFGRLDLSAGWGITRVFLIPTTCTTTGNPPVQQCAGDRVQTQDPRYPTDTTRTVVPHSIIKDQMGISAGAVFHLTPSFHLDLDLFRAQADWFLGEKQVLYVANAGMILTW